MGDRIMHQVAANVILVSLAVAATRDGLEKFDNPRSPSLVSAPSESENETEFVSFQWITEDATTLTTEKSTSENSTLLHDMKNDASFDFEFLLKEIKSCRKKFPNMSDRKFSFKLYNVLLNELTKTSNKTSNPNFCNISQGLLDGLKDTLHNLEVFQRDLMSKFDPTETPTTMQSSQQTNEPETIYSQRNFVRLEVENNLNFKLGEEWIPMQHKVNHMSHIYLGSSIFPLFTEESRIIDKYHTLPSPKTTKKTNVEHIRTERLSSTAEKVHRLLSPLRWQVDTKKRETRRHGRSLEKDAKNLLKAENKEEKPNSHSKSKGKRTFRRVVRKSFHESKASEADEAKEHSDKVQTEMKTLMTSWRKDFTKLFNISLLFN